MIASFLEPGDAIHLVVLCIAMPSPCPSLLAGAPLPLVISPTPLVALPCIPRAASAPRPAVERKTLILHLTSAKVHTAKGLLLGISSSASAPMGQTEGPFRPLAFALSMNSAPEAQSLPFQEAPVKALDTTIGCRPHIFRKTCDPPNTLHLCSGRSRLGRKELPLYMYFTRWCRRRRKTRWGSHRFWIRACYNVRALMRFPSVRRLDWLRYHLHSSHSSSIHWQRRFPGIRVLQCRRQRRFQWG